MKKEPVIKRILRWMSVHEPPWWLELAFAIPAIVISILSVCMFVLYK